MSLVKYTLYLMLLIALGFAAGCGAGGSEAPVDIGSPLAEESASPTSATVNQNSVNEEPEIGEGVGRATKPQQADNLKEDKNTQVVVAEGVGTSARGALEDAFREAVRQVVGTVVDAQTLIKNDELIEDKVLTYSDGFVRQYKKLSEKERDGLVRIKISALVERRSLVMKLKAANITVKDIDGSGLFAEAVTEMDAKRGATSLLKAALADLPTFLTVNVINKPRYDKDSSQIVVDLEYSIDRKPYAAFAKRLELLLKKISISHTSTLVNATTYFDSQKRPVPGWFQSGNHPELMGPDLVSKPGASCVWICSFNNSTHTTTRWNGYVVEADLVEAAAHLQQARLSALQRIWRPGGAGPAPRTMINMSALDIDGDLIVEDEWEMFIVEEAAYKMSGGFRGLPWLRHIAIRRLSGTGISSRYSGDSTKGLSPQYSSSNLAANLYIAPYFFTVKGTSLNQTGRAIQLFYKPTGTQSRSMKVSLDELKRIQEIVCTVSIRP